MKTIQTITYKLAIAKAMKDAVDSYLGLKPRNNERKLQQLHQL